MVATLIIGLIALLFAYTARGSRFPYGLEVAFTIITVFLAIRYDWGNDYQAYLQGFKEINSYHIDLFNWELMRQFRTNEIGWVFINRLCAPIGFFGMMMVLAVVQQYIIYRFIKRYVSPQWYWFAVLFYIFSASLMLTGASMMRQFLAMCIFIRSIDFIISGKPLRYYALVLLATTIHSSAWILLPIYLLRYLRGAINRRTTLLWMLAFGVFLIFSSYIFEPLYSTLIVMESFDRYQTYTSAGGSDGGLGVLYSYIIAFMLIYFMGRYREEERLLSLLYMTFFIIQPMIAEIAMLSRIGYYFSLTGVAAYPILYKHIPNRTFQVGVITATVLIVGKGFIDFFHSPVWHAKFYTYQTIFSVYEWM